MIYRDIVIEMKELKLEDMSGKDLVDHIAYYFETYESHSKMERTIQEIKANGYEMSKQKRNELIYGFASITIPGVHLAKPSWKPIQLPENFQSSPQWDYVHGGMNGYHIEFTLTEEGERMAVGVPTKDGTIIKIGYLDDDFVKKYEIKGNRTAPGSFQKGKIEIPFDLEKELISEKS